MRTFKRITLAGCLIGLIGSPMTSLASDVSVALAELPTELASVKNVPDAQLLAEAQKSWDAREDGIQTMRAVMLWDRAVQIDANHPSLYVSLTKASARVYRHSKGKGTKKRWAYISRQYGALAVEQNPDNSEAHARYAEALGQYAQANKGVGSLKVVKEAVSHLNRAIALDPQSHFAHMLLAQFYEQSPGIFSVGDKKKALDQAELAVKTGPNYAINRLTLAKIYVARDRKTEAKEQLEKALALTAPPDAIPETKTDQADARELLKTL